MSRTVVLAMGSNYQRLGVPNLEALVGAGVFYGGGVTEAQAMAGRYVYVAGGGNWPARLPSTWPNMPNT